jgi:amidase
MTTDSPWGGGSEWVPGRSKYEVREPTRGEVSRLAQRFGFDATEWELDFYTAEIGASLERYRRIASLAEPRPPVRYARTPGHRPAPPENPLNAWYWRCNIRGADSGPLAGKTVAVKDNICVAGVPMSNGSALLDGYVPDIDATVVTRILDGGGEIVGKAVAENMSMSGSSNTATTGFVHNPHRHMYSAGGSSSGSAALVAAGYVDLALGGDQGGSIRVPASLCGVCGLKATYGLIPYTGVLPIENTVDYVGPIARTIPDLALLLEVIAGPDGMDFRQQPVAPGRYAESVDEPASGLRIGVVAEGFGWPDGSAEDEQPVLDALDAFRSAGLDVQYHGIPGHRDGIALFAPIVAEGLVTQLVSGYGFGFGWRGYYPTHLMESVGRAVATMANDIPDAVKMQMILGTYMLERYGPRFYAKAQNLIRALRQDYDAALELHDVLVMPTCAPVAKSVELVESPSAEDVFRAGFRHHWNTCALNLTGHPAVTVPCGRSDGLPIGLMIVGRHFEEGVVLRVARVIEESGLYKISENGGVDER